MDLKNCIVHDISMRGISLLVDNATTLKIGDTVDVMFRYGAMLHNYELSTKVVRNFEVQGKRAVGCSISNLSVDLIGLLMSKKHEEQTPLDEVPETNLNPEISEKQQIREVEEDIAKDIIPERQSTLTISSGGTNPFDPANLEHITDKTLRQARQEERMAKQAKEIANLLELRDI